MRGLVTSLYFCGLCAFSLGGRADDSAAPRIPLTHSTSYALNSQNGHLPVAVEDRLQEVWVFDVPTSHLEYRQSSRVPKQERYESRKRVPIYVLPAKTPSLAEAFVKAGYVRRKGTHLFAAKETSHDTWMVWDDKQQKVLFKIKFQNTHQTSNSWSTTVLINDLIEDVMSDPNRISPVGYYPERTGLRLAFEVDGESFEQSYTLRENDVRYMRGFDGLKPVLDIPFFAIRALLKSENGHLFAPVAQEIIDLFPGALAHLNFADALYPVAHNQNFRAVIGLYPGLSVSGEPRYGLVGFGFQDTFDTAFDPVGRMVLGYDPRFDNFKEWVSIMEMHHSFRPRYREYRHFHRAFTSQIVDNFLRINEWIRPGESRKETIANFLLGYRIAHRSVLEQHNHQRSSDGVLEDVEPSEAMAAFIRTAQYSEDQWLRFGRQHARLRDIAARVLAEGDLDRPRMFFHSHYFTKLTKAQILANGVFAYRNGLIQVHMHEPNLVAVATFSVSEGERGELDATFGRVEAPTYLNNELAALNMIGFAYRYAKDFDFVSSVYVDALEAREVVAKHPTSKKYFYHHLADFCLDIEARLMQMIDAAAASSKPPRLFGGLFREGERELDFLPESMRDKLLYTLINHPEVLHPTAILQLVLQGIGDRTVVEMILSDMSNGRGVLDRIYKNFAASFGRDGSYHMIGDPTGMVHLAEWDLQRAYFDVLTKKREADALLDFLEPILLVKMGFAGKGNSDSQAHSRNLWARYIAYINRSYQPTRRKWALNLMATAHSDFARRRLKRGCQALVAAASAASQQAP